MTAADAPRCIKCGREVAVGETVCDVCNRAGMATPSATQYHGTVVVAIVLAVVGLALAASLSLRGVGPYAAEVREVAPAAELGHEITYAVTNEGTRPGRAKCQLVARGADGRELRARNTLTSQIPGGETVQLTETIPGLAEEPATVTITCS
jgi:hypothetical protein